MSLALCVVSCAAPASAQLLDRVLARIGTEAVTWTDVQAAAGFGLIEATSAGDPDALGQTVERRLVLNELVRFPPPEPSADAIDQQVVAMKTRAGSAALDEVMRSTGLDEARLRELARDTLRIQAYIAQRFGTSTQIGDEEARKYYDEHREQFTRNGVPIPFADVEADARQRASAERLRMTVAQWLRDLRARSGVVVVGKG